MSTHYTAGGMPLAFTQEDFLVIVYGNISLNPCWDFTVILCLFDSEPGVFLPVRADVEAVREAGRGRVRSERTDQQVLLRQVVRRLQERHDVRPGLAQR